MCDDWKYMIILAIVSSLIECWLGKTDKVKSSSIAELIYNVAKALLTKSIK